MRTEFQLEVFSSPFYGCFHFSFSSEASKHVIVKGGKKYISREREREKENVISIHVRSVQLPARNRKDKKAFHSSVVIFKKTCYLPKWYFNLNNYDLSSELVGTNLNGDL